MRGKQVYLAGPISGCTHDGCTEWRDIATQSLEARGAHCLSPMRAKDYLKDAGVLEGSYEEHVLSCSRGIMTRDFFDCTTCDLVLVNLLGYTRISIGTVMEIAWAYSRDIPLVCIIEPANPHNHPMIDEAIGFRVGTLEQAVDVVSAVLDLR